MPIQTINISENGNTKLRRALKLVFLPSCLFLLAVSSVAQTLAIKKGIYVQKQYSCKQAPNAATLVWDGRGLNGAHSSKCTSSVVSQNGATVQLVTSCLALGDGSPASPPFKENTTFVRLSNSRFTSAKEAESVTYRWCSALLPK